MPSLHALHTDNAGIPDAIEPVRAWRCWSAALRPTSIGQAWRLTSPAHRTDWPVDGALAARCRRRWHGAPGEECHCGIWALHEPGSDLLHMARAGGMPVLGEVLGWGRCIEGEKGWRVEYARPARLILPDFHPLEGSRVPPAQELAHDLAAYQIPVQIMDCRQLTELLRGGMRAIGAHR